MGIEPQKHRVWRRTPLLGGVTPHPEDQESFPALEGSGMESRMGSWPQADFSAQKRER